MLTCKTTGLFLAALPHAVESGRHPPADLFVGATGLKHDGNNRDIALKRGAFIHRTCNSRNLFYREIKPLHTTI